MRADLFSPPARVLVACKFGNIAPRDKGNHCLCSECKAEAYARRREWRKRNPEKVSGHHKKYRKNNKTKRAETVKNWRARNPEKMADMSAKAGAKWSRENRGKRNAITARRRAALRQRVVAWTDHDAIAAIYQEAARLTDETGISHEVDHIIPLQGELISGLHVHQNLRIVAKSVNRSKQNKWSAG